MKNRILAWGNFSVKTQMYLLVIDHIDSDNETFGAFFS